MRLKTYKEWQNNTKESLQKEYNQYTEEQWMDIQGVGKILASRLVEGGPYNDLDEIKSVKGVHKKVFDNIQEKFDNTDGYEQELQYVRELLSKSDEELAEEFDSLPPYEQGVVSQKLGRLHNPHQRYQGKSLTHAAREFDRGWMAAGRVLQQP